MTEWFQAGYFTMSLLVKRGCDDVFQPLGEIMKMWGRVPFASGAAPPPLQVTGPAAPRHRASIAALSIEEPGVTIYVVMLASVSAVLALASSWCEAPLKVHTRFNHTG